MRPLGLGDATRLSAESEYAAQDPEVRDAYAQLRANRMASRGRPALYITNAS